MKKSSQWAIIMIVLMVNMILLVIFWVITADAQFFFPTQSDYLALYELQALSSSLFQYSFGVPPQIPVNNTGALKTINPGFYPNATYFGSPAPGGRLNAPYIINATGYYTIEESASCTCNLP